MDNDRRQAICLLIDNYHDLKKCFFLNAPLTYLRLSSLILSLRGIRVNTETFRKNMTYIKQHTPWFSPFRSLMIPATAFAIQPEKCFDTAFNRLVVCKNLLRAAGFRPSSRLIPAAMALLITSAEGSERFLANQAFSVFKRLKPWCPSKPTGALFTFAVLSASLKIPIEEIMVKTDRVFKYLNIQGSNFSRGLHYLSPILTYDDSNPETTVTRCATINSTLKNMKFRSPALYFGTIGFLALTGDGCEQALLDTMDTMSLLKMGKCFSGLDREQGMLLASALVAVDYMKRSGKVSPIFSVQSLISVQVSACML